MLVDDGVALKYVFWEPRTSCSLLHSFLGLKRSGPMMSSTANHKSYKTLGRLHGPWYKHALIWLLISNVHL